MEPYSSKTIRRYNYLSGEIEAAYHELSLKLGVSDSAMRILYAICDSGDRCMLRDICRRSGVSKQTVNSAIRKLEQEGIVYLEPAGGKNKTVCLTETGRRLAQNTAVRVLELENEIFASWSEEETDRYLALTERYLAALREKTARISERSTRKTL